LRLPFQPARTSAQLVRGARLNIPQHPRGGSLQFAIRSNYYTESNEDGAVVRYVTDTDKGASGSPVCDDTWRVVALHARSSPIAAERFAEGTAHYINEGIAFDKIRAALPPVIIDRIG